MTDTLNLGARERVDFSQIRTAVQIPPEFHLAPLGKA